MDATGSTPCNGCGPGSSGRASWVCGWPGALVACSPVSVVAADWLGWDVSDALGALAPPMLMVGVLLRALACRRAPRTRLHSIVGALAVLLMALPFVLDEFVVHVDWLVTLGMLALGVSWFLLSFRPEARRKRRLGIDPIARVGRPLHLLAVLAFAAVFVVGYALLT